MNSKFPVLSFLSIVLWLVGVLIILAGLYSAWPILHSYYVAWQGGIEPTQYSLSMEDTYKLAGGVLGLIIGLSLVAFSEIIGVLFAIEANTRAFR